MAWLYSGDSSPGSGEGGWQRQRSAVPPPPPRASCPHRRCRHWALVGGGAASPGKCGSSARSTLRGATAWESLLCRRPQTCPQAPAAVRLPPFSARAVRACRSPLRLKSHIHKSGGRAVGGIGGRFEPLVAESHRAGREGKRLSGALVNNIMISDITFVPLWSEPPRRPRGSACSRRGRLN